MLYLINIYFALFCNLIWLNSDSWIRGDKFAKNNSTLTITSRFEQRNISLIFNAGTVLWSFSIHDVIFPISKKGPGMFVDEYNNTYKAYDNVTDILTDLKQKGYHLYAILNVCFASPRRCKKCDASIGNETMEYLPKKEEVDEVFRIFGWEELFDGIIYYKKEVVKILEKIIIEKDVNFEDIMYFDNDDKYDEVIVRRGKISRYIIKNGITHKKMADALMNFLSKVLYGVNDVSLQSLQK